MADTDEWDVLVVGPGPAGAAAAAARAGVGVPAVDRRAAAAAPANCPEFIPVALGAHAHAERILIRSIVGARSHSGGRPLQPFPGGLAGGPRRLRPRPGRLFPRRRGEGVLHVRFRAPLRAPFGAECGPGGEAAQAWSVVRGAFEG